jgi:hypothetical protein
MPSQTANDLSHDPEVLWEPEAQGRPFSEFFDS